MEKVLASAAEVNARIDDMAKEIVTTYKDVNPLFICFLRGGAPFASKLMFAIDKIDPSFQPQLEYMTVTAYGEERSARQPKLVMDLSPEGIVEGRTVLMIDDVLDTGTTADFVQKLLLARRAARVGFIVLVEKDNPRSLYPTAELAGFHSPAGKWLTGMGMDDAKTGIEAHRWNNHIQIVN